MARLSSTRCRSARLKSCRAAGRSRTGLIQSTPRAQRLVPGRCRRGSSYRCIKTNPNAFRKLSQNSVPKGHCENSPAFQRREKLRIAQVPKGRLKGRQFARQFLLPLRSQRQSGSTPHHASAAPMALAGSRRQCPAELNASISAVPSGLTISGIPPSVETLGYSRLSLRDGQIASSTNFRKALRLKEPGDLPKPLLNRRFADAAPRGQSTREGLGRKTAQNMTW